MAVTIVGIDCAVKDERIGLARAEWSTTVVRLIEARVCGPSEPASDVIAGWLQPGEPVLLALDAPLGWPAPLAAVLASHHAGAAIAQPANALFRRATDRDVRERLGKQSLDVGADRIARTAHAALALLGALRTRVGQSIPLAWTPVLAAGVSAIEVYPAATLKAWDVDSAGYKKPDRRATRARVLECLSRAMEVRAERDVLLGQVDALDAALCVLAACDFLRGQAVGPAPAVEVLARREGWIWVRDRP